MNKRLKLQVERILDEGHGERRTVIVQMESPEMDVTAFLEDSLEDINLNGMVLSARDLLPEPLGAAGKASKSFMPFTQAGRRFAQKATARGVSGLSIEEVKAIGLRSLQPLWKSPIVRRAIREAKKLYGPQFNKEAISFWPAHAMLLDISREDLRALPDAVHGIKEISPNQTIRTPHVLEIKNLPQQVTDSVASAWGLEKINALAVWGAYGVRGRGVTVGLLDSGVDAAHADLKGKVVKWAEFDKCGNAVAGSVPHADGEHGTLVAGTIVGAKYSGQWIGVAPEARLAAALVLNGSEGGTVGQVLAGVKWALDNRVDVINMSLGEFVSDSETPGAFAQMFFNCAMAGIPIITAIGNEGAQTTDTPGSDLFTISVGATDFNDMAAGFSGGRTQIIRESLIPQIRPPFIYMKPEFSAPGVAIKTSAPGNTWKVENGTSLAASHVSGTVALLLSATTIRQRVQGFARFFLIKKLIVSSVQELGETGQDQRFGFGRIDALRAIGFAHKLGY